MINRRALIIEPIPQSANLRIVWDGGGQVPNALSGQYTTHAAAKQAIIIWLAEQPDREVEILTPEEAEEQPILPRRAARKIQPI